MGANASTSPGTSLPKRSNPAQIPSPLSNEVITTNDTQMLAVPEGTVESNGANG